MAVNQNYTSYYKISVINETEIPVFSARNCRVRPNPFPNLRHITQWYMYISVCAVCA